MWRRMVGDAALPNQCRRRRQGVWAYWSGTMTVEADGFGGVGCGGGGGGVMKMTGFVQ